MKSKVNASAFKRYAVSVGYKAKVTLLSFCAKADHFLGNIKTIDTQIRISSQRAGIIAFTAAYIAKHGSKGCKLVYQVTKSVTESGKVAFIKKMLSCVCLKVKPNISAWAGA